MTLALLFACAHLPDDADPVEAEPEETPDGDWPRTDPDDSGTDDSGQEDTGTIPTDTSAPSIDGDGDGWTEEEDCDDANSAIHPAAEEVWYDAVDQDCDEDDDFDADGDGHYPEAYAGDDCDDTHPAVYAGAPEQCDELDHDCDAVSLPEGACADAQDIAALRVFSVEEMPTDGYFASQGAGFVGDLDGDGASEILFGCMWCDDGGDDGFEVLASVLPGGVEAHKVPRTSAQLAELGQPSAAFWFAASDPVPLGDFDGDGLDDMVMVTPDVTYYESRVQIFAGPADDWPEHGRLEDEAEIYWSGSGVADGFGYAHDAGDFDGDGLADLLVSAPNNVNLSDEPQVFLLAGRSDAKGGVSLFDEPSILGEEDTNWGLGVAMDVGGDLDGDGISDVLLSSYEVDALYVISGQDLPASGQVAIEDVVLQHWAVAQGARDCMAWPGDIDEDGYDDWFFGHSGLELDADDEGVLVLVTRNDEHDSDRSPLELVANYWVGGSEDRRMATSCLVPDFDGDGQREVYVGYVDPSDWRRYGRIIDTSALLSGPATVFPDGLDLTTSETNTQVPGNAESAGDYDGDGDDDLLFGTAFPSGTYGRGVVPGWDVPWDDPDAW